MSTRIWHDRFENNWMRAFPLGNGRIGAMLYGNPDCEQIEINEESLWSGKQLSEKSDASYEKLQQIRELMFAGRLKEARELFNALSRALNYQINNYEIEDCQLETNCQI